MNQITAFEAIREVCIYSTPIAEADWPTLIQSLLPDQGCIEVQRDVAGKEHAWHQHDTDETLVILDGSVRFYWDGGERVCEAGHVIALPSGVRHGSVALDEGATYLIAFQSVKLTHHG